ncbi:MAG: hypothetical protein MRJ65_16650 [Candidatus Brocadiaceae bacterium]|nr:hypothetical protein [Candidatus Brocadiaceae bacterium]
MDKNYEQLPFVDFAAPRAMSSRRNARGERGASEDIALQNTSDARYVLESAGLQGMLYEENILEPGEKYLIETELNRSLSMPVISEKPERKSTGLRKPHYTRLLLSDSTMVFQAACCLPLKVVAASLDGKPVTGRVLFKSHSEACGGKLVYEFLGNGSEMVLDLKRGESTKYQRLIFQKGRKFPENV